MLSISGRSVGPVPRTLFSENLGFLPPPIRTIKLDLPSISTVPSPALKSMCLSMRLGGGASGSYLEQHGAGMVPSRKLQVKGIRAWSV